MQNLPKLSDLQTILHLLDKDSDLYNSQAEVCALVAQLENNSYTVYSQDFGNMSWKDECDALGVPHEAMEVKIGFLVKEVKIDTSDIAKRFCLDNNLVRNYGDGRYYYDHPDNGINDMQIAHIEGDKLVYDINPIFQIGETFTLAGVYEDDGGTYESIETYTITGYDLSGCYGDGIAYLGADGSAWIMEDALIEQKAKFKVGDTFTVHFEHYAPGEVTTHTITRIDFSKQEFDEVVYWDENDSIYVSESHLIKQKEEQQPQVRTFFSITDVHGRLAVCGRFNASEDDMRSLAKESFPPVPDSFPSCYVGDGTIEVEAIGNHYSELDVEKAVFLARSAFCVQAVTVGKMVVNFLVDENILNDVISKKIQYTQELEYVISVAA
jgi:hypothetical protein